MPEREGGRGGEPPDRETEELDTEELRRRTEAEETSTFEGVSSPPPSSVEEDPLGESAAAAWAAGATPPPETIPEDDPTTTDEQGGTAAGSRTAAVAQPPPDEGVAADPEVEPVIAAPVTDPLEDDADFYFVPAADVNAAPEPSSAKGDEPAPAPRPDAFITERGHTILSDRVVEKIAGKAASEVDGVGGVEGSGLSRLAGLFSSDDDARRAHAEADVDRASTSVDLTVSIRYPEPVGATADRVRDHVRARLQELTGLEVTEVNVTVPELVPPAPPPPTPRVQ